MRTLAVVLGLVVLGLGLGACRQVCSTWDAAKCRVNSMIQSCSTACAPDPCSAGSTPVYPNDCGGDQGVGRGGTGAFARP